MTDTVDFGSLGLQVAHLQAEMRTMRGEINLARAEMGRVATRELLIEMRDELTGRLGNIEAELRLGFATVLAQLPGASGP